LDDQLRRSEKIMSNPAPSALMVKPASAPTHISVGGNLDHIELTMPHGEAVRVLAERLRAACRCAYCTRARIDGLFAQAFDGIAITHVAPVGDYAINIAFSDGHARGIYPWSLLLELRTDLASCSSPPHQS
jgi:prepilin-type processing-associated H-X9-DG protein